MKGSVAAFVALVALVLSPCQSAPSVNASGTTFYDQRQKGDRNVHVHVKDVGILAILDENLFGEYGEYDYSYDYQDPEDPDEQGGNKPGDEENPSTAASSSTTTMDTATEMGDLTTSEELSDSTAESDNLTQTTVTPKPESVNVTNTTTCENKNSTTAAPSKIEPSTTTAATTAGVDKETKKKTSTTGDSKLTSLPSTTTAATTVGVDRETKKTTTQVYSKPGGTAKPVVSDSTTTLPIIAMLVPVQQQEGGQKVHQGAGRRRCNVGYFRDSRGRCRRHRKPSYHTFQTLPIELPFGFRLSPRHASRTESN